MLTPIDVLHLYPVFAQVALVFIVICVLATRRYKNIKKGEIPVGYFKLYQRREGQDIPQLQEQAARNLTNLFEIPVIFFALVPLLIITGKTDHVSLTFCWIFVLSRYAHSFVHLTHNKLFLRMRTYFVGVLALMILWIRFFTEMM